MPLQSQSEAHRFSSRGRPIESKIEVYGKHSSPLSDGDGIRCNATPPPRSPILFAASWGTALPSAQITAGLPLVGFIDRLLHIADTLLHLPRYLLGKSLDLMLLAADQLARLFL